MQRWANDASAFADLLETAARLLRDSPYRARSVVRLPKRGRLLATGDMHDNIANLDAVVRLAALDESPRNSVVFHELIHGELAYDGVDRSFRMLGVVAELVLRYPLQVHPILANHEIAQCRRQPITKGGADNVECFDAGLEWAFGDEAEVAADAVVAFIRAMPIAVRCDNGLMISHSLPADAAMRWFDTRIFERDLFDEDFDGPDGSAYLMTWGRAHSHAQLERLADEWNVRTFLVGHQHAPQGIEYRAPNLVILNTDHDAGRVIMVDLEQDVPDAATLANRGIELVQTGPTQDGS